MLRNTQELTVQPTAVRRMLRFDAKQRQKVPTDNFTVTFPPGTKMDQLSQVKYLENGGGGFRPFFKQKGAKLHCARCQAWGHVKDVCHLSPKCIKCALGHYSWECTVIMKDSPRELMRCINCGYAGHPANYTGCVKAVEYFRASRGCST